MFWLQCAPRKACFTCVKGRCMLAVVCTQEGMFYLCEGEVCWLYCVPRKACFACVRKRCLLAIMCSKKAFFTCVKEWCVGCNVYPGKRVLPV